MKRFLILQLRVIDEAADNEFEAFLKYGKLLRSEVLRIRMEKESFADLNPNDFAGIIVGGGPSNVSDKEDEKPDYQKRFEEELNVLYPKIFENDSPYMGSCYGLGSIIKYAGGVVSKANYAEDVGHTEVQISANASEDPLLKDLPGSFKAFCGHKEAVQELPDGAELLAGSEKCPVHMVRFGRNIYATQFHCELDADGLIERINYYKYHGYFDPGLAEDMIADAQEVVAEVPHEILRRFVEKYRR